jgi:hypothetical protein
MRPPTNAMSAPALIGTCRSACALVRVNRGSTWITFAPRFLASITHWNPTGCASAMFEPSMRMQSELARSCGNVVAPPRPNEVPRPGTVAECQMRAWFSIWIAPSAVNSFLIR